MAALRAQGKMTERQIADRLYADGMGCNCDLDNWQPEQHTGHSWVCRIHKRAVEIYRNQPRGLSAGEAPSAGTVNSNPQASASGDEGDV